MKKISFCLLFVLTTSCSSPILSNNPKLRLYQLNDLEGLSGLAFQGTGKDDELIFWSHTDRGPNETEIMDPKIGQKRPFIEPHFKPYWVQFSVHPESKKVSILKKINLDLSGLPNTNADEVPVNENGIILDRDLMGVDPEAICFDGKYVWMAEEYRPSILKFSLDGKLLRRFVPEDSFTFQNMKHKSLAGIVSQVLPAKLKTRKLNRGFEGLACNKNKVYAILQSPLPKSLHQVVMIEFESTVEKVTGEFYYPMEAAADKIGDLVLHGDDFYAIEQNGGIGPESFHRIYNFKLQNSENGLLQKNLIVDLVKDGFNFADKVEGLAILHNGEIAIVNDNDFGVGGSSLKSFMGIVKP